MSDRLAPSLQLLQAPPHVLPPPTSLCGPFMRRLLPPSAEDCNGEDMDHTGVFVFCRSLTIFRPCKSGGVGEELNGTESESEDEGMKAKRKHVASNPQAVTSQTSGSSNCEALKASNYDWLADCLSTL